MASLGLLKTLPPWHILAYGTLLGVEFHQTFIQGIVAFRALPRPQFGQLQKALFPVYWTIQGGLPLVLALTFPGIPGHTGTRESYGISGFLNSERRWDTLLPISIIFASAVLNMLYFSPKTVEVMKKRKQQETKDQKRWWDPPPHSAEMQKLNREFGKMHGFSALCNIFAVISTIFYGLTIAAMVP